MLATGSPVSGLTASGKNYLKTIESLTRGGESTSVTELAAALSITKASASCAVSNLERLGLIERPGNRRILLTDEGARQARVVIGRFETIRTYFAKILHMNDEAAAREANALASVLSDRSLSAISHALRESDRA